MTSLLSMVEEIASVGAEKLIVTPDGREECMDLHKDNLCCFAQVSLQRKKIIQVLLPPTNNNGFPDVPSSFTTKLPKDVLRPNSAQRKD
eukprot:9843497-Ditylum_brightwellii.AAC.1